MQCNFPVGTYRTDGSITSRPCGRCAACRLENSRQWAMRCVHESKMHEENSFITLTYNNENLPKDKSIKKDTVSKFMKKLRKKIEKPVRFFACGEYGEVCEYCGQSRIMCYKNGCGTFKKSIGRPHYHLALFGYDFQDKEVVRYDQSKLNNHLYKSEQLQEIWQKGFCSIGSLTFDSAGYIARYVTKKITGEIAEDHYKGRQPEFALMSRMPGIGKPWIDKYINDVYPKDFVTVNGHKMRPCRYYDSLMAKKDVHAWLEIKAKRKENEVLENKDDLRERYSHERAMRETIKKQLPRSLDYGNNPNV